MVVFAFHKPLNVTTEMGTAATHGREGRNLVLNDWVAPLQQRYPVARRIVQVGRLDKHTSGLLLLTDDGTLNERVLRPGILSKVYEAKIKLSAPKCVTHEQIQQLRNGVHLADGFAQAEEAELIESWDEAPPAHARQMYGIGKRKQGGVLHPRRGRRKETLRTGGIDVAGASVEGAAAPEAVEDVVAEVAADIAPDDAASATAECPLPMRHVAVVRLTINSGRNRIVRRLLAAVGLPVFMLRRVCIGPLHIDELGAELEQPGGLRELTPTQERELRTACGLGEMAPVHGSALAPASAPAALGLMPECEPAQADAFSGATKPEGASALEEEGAGVAGASLLTSDV